MKKELVPQLNTHRCQTVDAVYDVHELVLLQRAWQRVMQSALGLHSIAHNHCVYHDVAASLVVSPIPSLEADPMLNPGLCR